MLFIDCSDKKKGEQKDSNKIVYVKYKQPVNNYDVNIKYNISSKDKDSFTGDIVFLSNQDTILATTVTSSFDILGLETNSNIAFDSLSNEQTFLIDYYLPENKQDTTSFNIEGFGDNSQAPFYFYDVNFDGKDEIIKFNGGYGQKSIRLYSFYSFPEDITLNFETDLEGFDGWWLFDKKNKKVITRAYGGWDYDSYQIWKWSDKKDSLVLLKDIELEGSVGENMLFVRYSINRGDKVVNTDSISINESDFWNESFFYKGID